MRSWKCSALTHSGQAFQAWAWCALTLTTHAAAASIAIAFAVGKLFAPHLNC